MTRLSSYFPNVLLRYLMIFGQMTDSTFFPSRLLLYVCISENQGLLDHFGQLEAKTGMEASPLGCLSCSNILKST